MNRNASSHYDTTATGGETVRAFVPFPLPPDPPLDFPETANASWNAPPSPSAGSIA